MEELREQLQGKRNVDCLDASYCVYGTELRDNDDNDEDDDSVESSYYGTYFAGYDVKGAFYLSPIQEHSEPSSSDGSGSDHRHRGVIRRWISCRELTATREGRRYENETATAAAGRCWTYPRSRADETAAARHDRRKYTTGYPLEQPRELDPEMFFQLHTADSQDELQEFLLLESQCMSTDGSGGGGLHSAFVDKSKKSQNEKIPNDFQDKNHHTSWYLYTEYSRRTYIYLL